MKEKLDALRQSAVGRFVRRFLDDRGLDLAVLLAWGTLNTMLPLILGLTAIAGLVLQDEVRLRELNDLLLQAFPRQAAEMLGTVLDDTRKSAGALGVIGFGLLLFNGSGFFANMESVFNKAYRVPDRNPIAQKAVAVLMLVVVASLLLLSTTAFSLGGLLSNASNWLLDLLPFEVPGRGLLGAAIGWSVSIGSAILMFTLIYTVLPNHPLRWREALPGALLATALFFFIMQLFPLYLAFFGRGFQTYALFGVFLLLMFWCYLLGIVLVLGAEMNAFRAEPAGVSQDAAAVERQVVVVPVPVDPNAARGPGVGGRLVGVFGVLLALLMLRRRASG